MITSENNERIKFIKSLRKRKYRQENNAFYVEGHRIVVDGIKSSKEVKFIVVSMSYIESTLYNELRNICFAHNIDAKQVLLRVSDLVFSKISDTKSPQGILGVFNLPLSSHDSINGYKKVVLLENLQDPGNMGTIIRTADAAGFDAVIYGKGSVDAYNSKVLRSTAGSIFHIDVLDYEDDSIEIARNLKLEGYTLYCTHLKGEVKSFDLQFEDKLAIVIGNEAKGVSQSMATECDILTTIPMQGKAESLNASVAAALMIYEVMRKEKTYETTETMGE